MVSLWVQVLTVGVLMEMVFIPSGEFLMGSTEKDGKVGQAIGVDEIPQHSVNIQGFHIDLHEVTNTQYTGYGEILPAGSVPGDVSPYGVYDMCGNVSEWTDSWYLPYPGSTLKREDFGETYKVVRGGSLVMPSFPYSRAAYRATTNRPDYRHRGIGFRCVKDGGT